MTLAHPKLPWQALLPLRGWIRSRFWLEPKTLLFLVFAVSPFFLLHMGNDPDNFQKVSWGFAVYFAALWGLGLHALLRPGHVDRSLMIKIVVAEAFTGGALAIALEKALTSDDMGWLGFVTTVGGPEELAKILPVAVFGWRYGPSLSLRGWTFLGVLSGLVFGASEAVTYSTATAKILPFIDDGSSAIVSQVWRLVTDGLFHACMCGIAAFFFGLGMRYVRERWLLAGVGFVLASVLHGTYDTLAEGWWGVIVAGLILFVFTGYVRHGDAIASEVDVHLAAAAVPLWVAAAPSPAGAQVWAARSSDE